MTAPDNERPLPRPERLRAEAADQANLRRIQEMLTTRLENFGRREHLIVTWDVTQGAV